MAVQPRDWVEILSSNDAEALWSKLFKLVSKHPSVITLTQSKERARETVDDILCHITQELFLKLHHRDRWNHYLNAGYLNSDIDHELYHIEVPNLVSLILRYRAPEAYRIARRISEQLENSREFQLLTYSGLNRNREQVLLEGERRSEADAMADETLKKLRVAVRNKPTRYWQLVNVAWHCYFNHSSPTKTHIAQMIGISTSLVTYYRKLFDSVVCDVRLDADQYVPFLHYFCIRLKTSISEIDGTYDDQ